MKSVSTFLLLTLGLLAACSREKPPTDFRGEFELFRCDYRNDAYVLLLYGNGNAIYSQRSVGMMDLPCRWSEEEGVIHITGWDMSTFVEAFAGQSYEEATEVFFHRRQMEGSEVLVPDDSIEAFDADDFSGSWIYWKAGRDAVVGSKIFLTEDKSGLRHVSKRLDD